MNDFNYLGRTYEVVAQADEQFRKTAEDISRFKVRNAGGEMVPIGSVANFNDETTPYRQPRYNLYPAADVLGIAAPGVASGTAMAQMEALATQILPPGFSNGMDGASHQQEQQGIPTIAIFAASAFFVFLVLAAQYESWKLPLAIVLIVPMCLLASATGLALRGMPIDILAQIGFVVLVGLAAKNAILIVEFARQKQDHEGDFAEEAATAAAGTPSSDPDDLLRLYSWCLSACRRDWGGLGDAPVAGHCCILWNAGGYDFRPDIHSGLLRFHPQTGDARTGPAPGKHSRRRAWARIMTLELRTIGEMPLERNKPPDRGRATSFIPSGSASAGGELSSFPAQQRSGGLHGGPGLQPSQTRTRAVPQHGRCLIQPGASEPRRSINGGRGSTTTRCW